MNDHQQCPRKYIGTFHKTGTALFGKILQDAETAGLFVPWFMNRDEVPPTIWDIGFDHHSKFVPQGFESDPNLARYVICIRDPRDVMVSSAYYHMKSHESWLHVPRSHFGGRTYQETINALPDMQARFQFEMSRIGAQMVRDMLAIPREAPSVYVTRLETLVEDIELDEFGRIFDFLGFEGETRSELLEIARANSLFAQKPQNSGHVRSGRPAQYLSEFSDETLAMYYDKFGDAAEKLGYPGDGGSFASLPSPAVPRRAANEQKPDSDTPRRYIGTFHKTGTVLFNKILRDAQKQHLLTPWFMQDRPEAPSKWNVGFDYHSSQLLDGFSPDPETARYVICVRDPRDVVVSAAYYHMKSSEAWLHKPRREFEGHTYQEAINALPDMQARFRFEMRQSARKVIGRMQRIPIDASSVCLTRLETLVEDTELMEFDRIFNFLGFDDPLKEGLLEIARANSLFSQKSHPSGHVRSGRPAQYLSEFSDETLADYYRNFGDVAQRLGYAA